MLVTTSGLESWASGDERTRLVFSSGTHPGRVREVNEDTSLIAPPVFLVADGMGGYARGDVASRLVAEAFEPLAAREVTPDDVEDAISAAQHRVSALALEFSSPPGSTLVAAVHVLQDGRGYWLLANLGDSRAYTFRDGVLEQVSRDHSVVQELIDAGELTRDEALGHPDRHVITRAIGALTRPQADFALIPAEAGSRLLLCSDGLTTELSDTAIGHILSEHTPPEVTVLTLVDAAVAAGGSDNVTALLVDVVAVEAGSPGLVGGGDGPAELPLEDTRPSAGTR